MRKMAKLPEDQLNYRRALFLIVIAALASLFAMMKSGLFFTAGYIYMTFIITLIVLYARWDHLDTSVEYFSYVVIVILVGIITNYRQYINYGFFINLIFLSFIFFYSKRIRRRG